jgi:UDPglucose 6-dehydrogenase
VIAASAGQPPCPWVDGQAACAPVTVYGAGYVGLVTAACLAEMMHTVVCMDTDPTRVSQLSHGHLPFHEPGLEDLIVRNGRRGRLLFTTDPGPAARHGTIQIIAVGTPCGWDGAADVRHVLAVARQIGARLQHDAVVVCKSTAPVGTAERVRQLVHDELRRSGARQPSVHVVANPEFLREGTAVDDFMHPDRLVVGADDARALQALRALYAPLLRQPGQWVPMSVRAAELTKYACNAMLATRISVMNDFALLAERLQVDIEEVRRGMASDPRIGPRFLAPGCGFGGSCLPKDLRALQRTAMDNGVLLPTLAAVEQTNLRQRALLARRVIEQFGGSLPGRRIALWGLAFKPGTDDLREAPSETIIASLVTAGARIVAHDPVAMPAAQRRHQRLSALSFAVDPLVAVEQADALIIATDWPQYAAADWAEVRRRMAAPYVFDGRNVCEPDRMAEHGFHYVGVGRGHVARIAATTSVRGRRDAVEPMPSAPPLSSRGALSAALRP